jgi:hypothetical protein
MVKGIGKKKGNKKIIKSTSRLKIKSTKSKKIKSKKSKNNKTKKAKYILQEFVQIKRYNSESIEKYPKEIQDYINSRLTSLEQRGFEIQSGVNVYVVMPKHQAEAEVSLLKKHGVNASVIELTNNKGGVEYNLVISGPLEKEPKSEGLMKKILSQIKPGEKRTESIPSASAAEQTKQYTLPVITGLYGDAIKLPKEIGGGQEVKVSSTYEENFEVTIKREILNRNPDLKDENITIQYKPSNRTVEIKITG